jgi:DnaJ-class molecular chaperone
MQTDPYEVLNLSPQADEQAIRQRYLELVRQFPPDRAPQQFAAIRAAYEALHDPVQRWQSRLFEMRWSESLEEIVTDLRRQCIDPRRMGLKTILQSLERS